MPFAATANREAYTGGLDSVSAGPRLGFLGSFEAAWDAQVRASAQYGIEDAFFNLEQDQVKSIRAAGHEAPESLTGREYGFLSRNLPGPAGGVERYLDVARFYEDGGSPEMADRLSSYDRQIEKLRETMPDLNLRTSRELWDEVKTRAQEAEDKWSSANTTFFGGIGGFAGGAAASLKPGSDPLNAVTLGVGGVGKTAFARIASQIGGQAAIETVNQLTGVQEERRLLGVDYGLSQAATAIGQAAIGAGVLQGAGEALAKGFGRWFRSTPKDPAPPLPAPRERAPAPAPEPGPVRAEDVGVRDFMARYEDPGGTLKVYGDSRNATRVFGQDLRAVARQLDEFDGPAPWELRPHTDTAVPVREGVDFRPYTRATERIETVDDVARKVDPETFRSFDKLRRQQAQLRANMEQLQSTKAPDVSELDRQIDTLTNKLQRASAKNRKRIGKQITELENERTATLQQAGHTDTPEQYQVRQQLIKVDEAMRDLAPLVSRAYSAAEGKWKAEGPTASALSMLRQLEQGRSVHTRVDSDAPPVATPRSLEEKVPALSRGEAAEDIVGDAADRLAAVTKEDDKVIDEAVDRFVASMAKAAEDESGEFVTANGLSLNLKDDFIDVPTEGGGSKRLSIAAYLDELREDEDALKAVTTCSVR